MTEGKDLNTDNGQVNKINVTNGLKAYPHEQHKHGDLQTSGPRVSFSDDVKLSVIPEIQLDDGRHSLESTRNSSAFLVSGVSLEKQTILEKFTSQRWILAYMCFLTVMLSVMLRQCMSMAIVCMKPDLSELEIITVNGTANNTNSSVSHFVPDKWQIMWTSEEEGLVLQSYFYGLPLTPFLGGYLSGRFSGKIVVIVSIVTLIITSAFIPYAATVSPNFVVGLRILAGLCSGGLQPSITPILSKWAPVSERAQIVAVANAGMMIGTMLNFIFSGLICTIPLQNGWPFIFYIFGILNVVGLIMWIALVHDSPAEHPKVTLKERMIIARHRRDSTIDKMPSPPWKAILTSRPFWGLLSAHMTHGFLFTTIGTFLPIYMNDVLKFDSTSNGLLSSLPFLGRFCGSIAAGYIADTLYTKKVFRITTIRKLFQFIGRFCGSIAAGYIADTLCTKKVFRLTTMRKLFQFIGNIFSAPFLVGLAYMGESQRDYAVVLLVGYWTVMSLNNAGFRVNHIDIAPRFAGVLNGMTTTMAATAGLISPIVTSELTKNGTREEWQVVFYVCLVLGVLGAAVFIALGDATEQDWAKDKAMEEQIDVQNARNGTNNPGHSNGIAQMKNGVTKMIDSELVDPKEIETKGESKVDGPEIGVLNEGFDAKEENDMKEIIKYVRLSNSFRHSNVDTAKDYNQTVENQTIFSDVNMAKTNNAFEKEKSPTMSIDDDTQISNGTDNADGEVRVIPSAPEAEECDQDNPRFSDMSKFHARTQQFREYHKIQIPEVNQNDIIFEDHKDTLSERKSVMEEDIKTTWSSVRL